jgi:FlaA1/EpsC-like NDP-sugar epimerase
MYKIPLLTSRYLIIMHDLGMAMLAWFCSWWIRYNLIFPFPELEICLYSLPVIVTVQSIIFWRFNLYRGIWRFASLPDLWNIFRASILGSLIIMVVLFALFRLEGVPRSIVILYPILLIILLGAPRLGYRLWKDHRLNLGTMAKGTRIFIIGAGRAGEMLAREMLRDGSFIPIGFIDDDAALARSEIHGIRVLGPVNKIDIYAEKYGPELIVIAVPSATNEEMQRIVELAERTKLPVRTLPKINEMISNKASIKELREVSIEDLLGREKVELDWSLIQKGITSKVVMVTGGGGSIGSELCRQIAKLNPKKLIIFERSEFNLYKILEELSGYKDRFIIEGVLGDVCDKIKIDNTFKSRSPQVVFHAAAYKHVPLLENQSREAVRNNVLGTFYTANAAEKHGSEKFIFISTDKAVNPVNVLGATKRLSEIYCQSRNKISHTVFITVRFGNVLGSDGSVVPLFQKQINAGGPVTVTHPDITRYFMTISESCQLILQAALMGTGGEIYVLDMGKPVKILYLAEQMITLSNPASTSEIEIKIIGLRPGEKLTEELFYDNEEMAVTSHNKILLARHQDVSVDEILNIMKQLENASDDCDQGRIQDILNRIVPFGEFNNTHNNNVIPIKQA